MTLKQPTTGNFSPNILEALGIGEISQAEFHATQVIDAVEWDVFKTANRGWLLQDGKFAIIVKETQQSRLILISIIPGGGASLNDAPRIAMLENSLINGTALPPDLDFQQRELPTTFVVNYDGISGMAGQNTVKYGTTSSRQLLRNPNFQQLILYTNNWSVLSPLIDITTKILGSRFHTLKNEQEAIQLAKNLL